MADREIGIIAEVVAKTQDIANVVLSLARVTLLRHRVPEVVEVRLGTSDGVHTEVLAGDVRPGERAIVEAKAAGGAGRRFKIF